MEIKFRIERLINNTYQVLDQDDNVHFQGSLSDCSSWLQLNK
jgi:hypothetical protein